ncbi:MAG: hypothetical protein KatS3mg043_0237 [Rhodothermaceae bacterium]|nr:MAG: hypothetical protein KatS3mg043_0237 [Rhodothermaceae bacterium]
MSETVTFALALLSLDGVGRVTAGRLLKHFASYEALRRCPREQVLFRLKGVPNAAGLVNLLFDEARMRPHLEAAGERLRALQEKHIALLAPARAEAAAPWPPGLADLPRRLRPVLLYAYGDTALLVRPAVALFARPPLRQKVFETAQALVRHLCASGLVPAAGIDHGFDVVVHKLAAGGAGAHPSILVAACGLARLPAPMRPVAAAAVRAGGLLCSSFPPDHGPYPHDDRERALLLAGLARATVFFEPRPQTPEWAAMTWALEAGRPVFGIPDPDHPPPETLHRLHRNVDFEWVTTAARV